MWSFLSANLWRSAFLAALAALSWQTVQIEGFWVIDGLKDRLASSQQATQDEQKAHKKTKDGYAQAQVTAQLLEQQRIDHVEAEQERITQNVKSSYDRRLAELRARFDRLRNDQAGTSAGGASDHLDLSGVSGTAGGAHEAPVDHGLSAEERLIASEQALQLDELISFVESQLRVTR